MNRIQIDNPFSDAPVYYRDVTDSTMDDSKNDASEGILHGTVYRAGFQKKGRGRIRGRRWFSTKGLNLTFTLVLKRQELKHELNLMPLIAGMAVTASVCELTGKKFQLKWPNDLLYKGMKCAGILCEADSNYFYCGIGVNCNQTDFAEGIRQNTVSLCEITRSEIDLNKLQTLILKQFRYFLETGDLWRSQLDNFLYKKNDIIEVQQGQADSEDIISGKNIGIGADGQLLIEQSDGKIVEIYAGEIEM
jgi:BirA family transcriptional regulator, biotin operon repressor / biotin---[acetyl-CoA-carboxylase] ligase